MEDGRVFCPCPRLGSRRRRQGWTTEPERLWRAVSGGVRPLDRLAELIVGVAQVRCVIPLLHEWGRGQAIKGVCHGVVEGSLGELRTLGEAALDGCLSLLVDVLVDVEILRGWTSSG